MAQHANEEDEEGPGNDTRLTVGACLFRDGRLDEAVRSLTEFSAHLDLGSDGTDKYYLACGKYFLSMSRSSLGQSFQARRVLDEANDLAERAIGTYWKRDVALRTLRQEATSKLDD
jgi:hypothetical protein